MSNVIVMDFTATWCGPCQIQKPILEQLEGELGDKVEFKMVDVDQNNALAGKYGISAVPTLIIEKDGEVVKRYTGVTSADVLRVELNALI
ncbi:thioredoxin family protein [Methanococcoides seepicolus]|uniref:Thioredoxin fold domain-containing protein n=1 Tax=Methanococcoides seepicolus TaxID=2828780 RepID=A0A9E5DCJ0_9EURY|nr:thioredoxin domain-containing protein [Methanococcoides seepicolus]MCM1987807.1 thioredoxin fold domain-containing protein [Methanococcoides seepicolus]